MCNPFYCVHVNECLFWFPLEYVQFALCKSNDLFILRHCLRHCVSVRVLVHVVLYSNIKMFRDSLKTFCHYTSLIFKRHIVIWYLWYWYVLSYDLSGIDTLYYMIWSVYDIYIKMAALLQEGGECGRPWCRRKQHRSQHKVGGGHAYPAQNEWGKCRILWGTMFIDCMGHPFLSINICFEDLSFLTFCDEKAS